MEKNERAQPVEVVEVLSGGGAVRKIKLCNGFFDTAAEQIIAFDDLPRAKTRRQIVFSGSGRPTVIENRIIAAAVIAYGSKGYVKKKALT